MLIRFSNDQTKEYISALWQALCRQHITSYHSLYLKVPLSGSSQYQCFSIAENKSLKAEWNTCTPNLFNKVIKSWIYMVCLEGFCPIFTLIELSWYTHQVLSTCTSSGGIPHICGCLRKKLGKLVSLSGPCFGTICLLLVQLNSTSSWKHGLERMRNTQESYSRAQGTNFWGLALAGPRGYPRNKRRPWDKTHETSLDRAKSVREREREREWPDGGSSRVRQGLSESGNP